MTNDFKILIDSLGNSALGMLGDGVEALRILPDEYLGTARVGIVLRHDDWDARLAVLARADTVREMFIDELVLEFVFQDRGEQADKGESATPSASAELEYA